MFRDVFKPLAFPLVMSAIVLGSPPALADDDDDDDNDRRLRAVPFVFVGTADQCAPSPAGSRIVTSAWLGGMGLPDNGGLNTQTNPPNNPAGQILPNPNKSDPHLGLLLSKNGPTPDCSSAGAVIERVRGMRVTATFTLGYDYRNGGHCGAGAPRFNVDTDMGFFFVGCASAPQAPAEQDPTQWTRTRSVLADCGVECFPGPIPVGARIKSITILYDEGTDTANSPGEIAAGAAGLAVLDNIFINGRFIRRGSGIEPKPRERDRDDD